MIKIENLNKSFGKRPVLRGVSVAFKERQVVAVIGPNAYPSVIILDEPTAGLDPLASEILKDKIKDAHEKGKLVLITSHVLSDLDDLATHVLYLQEGQIRFFKLLKDLQEETGEIKLGRILAHIMKGDKVGGCVIR